VFIIGCPRSGTTLLYRVLAQARSLWSIGGESRHIIERIHNPERKDWESGELTAADLTPESRRTIAAAFEEEAAPGSFWRRVNRLRSWLDRRRVWRSIKGMRAAAGTAGRLTGGVPRYGMAAVRWWVRQRNRLAMDRHRAKRLLEKTPENCLRLPFLLEIFPDGRIIHLTRDGRSNTSSLMEGWSRPDLFPGYPIPESLAIPGVPPDRWAFTLIPGWRDLLASPLEEVCARQWIACNEAVLRFREGEGRSVPWLTVRYEDLIAETGRMLTKVASFAEVALDLDERPLPGANLVSAPEEDKWQRLHGEAIGRVEDLISPTMQRLGYHS